MSQSSEITGNHNIVVQAQGDGVTVALNHPHLSLTAWHRRQRKPEKLLDLLNPFMRAIPYVGRKCAKADLEKWLTSDPVISVRCLIGGGGSGKTRLAIELCESADESNWSAGFVSHQELTRFSSQQNLSNWGWSKDTLVVVDYAAAQARVLRQWLVELAQNIPSTGRRLRLLLLDRHADPDLGWWHDLATPGTFSEEPILALFDPITPVVLPPIAASDQIRDILAHVMVEASNLLRRPRALEPPARGENPEFDGKLADPSITFAPLYLAMAGITAVQEGIPTLLGRGRADMAQRIATDELSRVAKLARDRGLNADLLMYVVAGVSLAGGFPRENFLRCVVEERQALGYAQQDNQGVADAARDALGVQTDRVLPILPDLIGEGAILQQLVKLPQDQQRLFIARWFERASSAVAATVIRTAQDYTAAHDPIRWLDAVIDPNQTPENLWQVLEQLPQNTVRLRSHALSVAQVIVSGLQRQSGNTAGRLALAIALNNLINRLIDLGCREEALMRAREAVTITRDLESEQPYAYLPILATSLSNLANALGELGKGAEALSKATEAADIRRRLAVEQPRLFRHDLAASLTNMAVCLSNVGMRDEALAQAQEATQLYRELTGEKFDTFRPLLALSLNNLARMQDDVGQGNEALATVHEAVIIYRELAAMQPDAFRPKLAMSLNNLANALNGVNRSAEAISPAQEAVHIRRGLAANQPDVFNHDLAQSLNVLSIALSISGQPSGALEAAREAVTIRRSLVALRRNAFLPDLAGSLGNMVNILGVLEQWDEALMGAEETVLLFSELSAEKPAAFQPALARSYLRLAECFDSMSRTNEALRYNEMAVKVLGPLYISTPAPFAKLIARILSRYRERVEKAGLEPSPEMTELLTQILQIDPKSQQSSLLRAKE
jgi:tetratricopeptide (TPR) repeat protein